MKNLDKGEEEAIFTGIISVYHYLNEQPHYLHSVKQCSVLLPPRDISNSTAIDPSSSLPAKSAEKAPHTHHPQLLHLFS